MKTIYVKVYSAQEAEEYAKNLYRILRDCTPVIADLCLKKAEVRTETVLVKYISNKRTDGMRCDIPCGFGELGKIMAGMKPYKEIKDGKELVDFIIKEEESGKRKKDKQLNRRMNEIRRGEIFYIARGGGDERE